MTRPKQPRSIARTRASIEAPMKMRPDLVEIGGYAVAGVGRHAPAVVTPATYVFKGTQYVVFVAGGNTKRQASDQVAAFALT